MRLICISSDWARRKEILRCEMYIDMFRPEECEDDDD